MSLLRKHYQVAAAVLVTYNRRMGPAVFVNPSRYVLSQHQNIGNLILKLMAVLPPPNCGAEDFENQREVPTCLAAGSKRRCVTAQWERRTRQSASSFCLPRLAWGTLNQTCRGEWVYRSVYRGNPVCLRPSRRSSALSRPGPMRERSGPAGSVPSLSPSGFPGKMDIDKGGTANERQGDNRQ